MIRLRIVVVIAILAPFAWLFGSVLDGHRSFAYRDAAQFYYPLFQWTAQEWSQGRIPLWNPHENCGVPIAANPTSSVFYPGKLIFAIPGLDFTAAYNWYVIGHVLLAALGAYWLAVRFGASVLAAGACALSYAYSGNVLFQYCNVVFLVGAAWLPVALLAAERMLTDRNVYAGLAFGAVLALMVLGGDPQMAYHAGLLATLLAIFLWRADWRNAPPEDATQPPVKIPFMKRRFTLLAVSAVVAVLLAAVQVVPALQWSRQSDRASFDVPRSVYEIPAYLARSSGENQKNIGRDIRAGVLGEARRGTHHDHVYQFSLAPWRVVELVWPNITGRSFPINRRWESVLPGADRLWTPSIYMGLLPLLLALGSFRWFRGPTRTRWATWVVVLSGLGSLGWFGLGWAIHEFRCSLQGANPQDVLIGHPVGGVYWLMVTLLPGYVYFRFPAKLLIVTALGLSLLAAQGWDRTFSRSSSRLPRVLAGVALVSLVGAVLFQYLGQKLWFDWLKKSASDGRFGPIDIDASSRELLFGLIYTALLCVTLYLVWMIRGRDGRRAIVAGMLALIVTAVDLAISQTWLIVTAPAEQWRQPSEMAQFIRSDDAARGAARPYRVYRGSFERWVPKIWRLGSSPNRPEEILRWDSDTLYPQYNLAANESLVEAYGTMASNDFYTFMNVAKYHGPERQDHMREPPRFVLDALSARYLVLSPDVDYQYTAEVVPADRLSTIDAQLSFNPQAFPRAWIVHEVEELAPIDSADLKTVRERTEYILFGKKDAWILQGRDFSRMAIVETSQVLPPLSPSQGGSEHCEVISIEPQRVELQVVLSSPGFVVLNDFYYPGWAAEVVTDGSDTVRTTPIIRTNRIMRGISLPPGNHTVVFRYQPTDLYLSAGLSALAWLVLIIVGGWHLTRKQRSWWS